MTELDTYKAPVDSYLDFDPWEKKKADVLHIHPGFLSDGIF